MERTIPIITSLFLIAVVFLMLGCIGGGEEETANKTVITHQYGYGAAVKVTMPIKEVLPGVSISFPITIVNTGDFDMKVKELNLGGSTVAVEITGGIITTKDNPITILKNNQYVSIVTFKVRKGIIGGQEISLFPIVCYSYKSEAQASVQITSDLDTYNQYSGKTPQTISSASPIMLRIEFPAGQGIYYAPQAEDKKYKTQFMIAIVPDVSTKAGKGWPVQDCSEKTNKTIREFNLTIIYPADANLTILNGANYLECADNYCKSNETTKDIYGGKINGNVKELRVKFKEDYSRYQPSVGFTPIYLTIEYSKEFFIDLDEIRIKVDADYDFYEIMDGATVRLKVVKSAT